MSAAIDRAYTLEALLRVISFAVEATTGTDKTFERIGGLHVLELAADMAGQLVDDLEKETDGAQQ